MTSFSASSSLSTVESKEGDAGHCKTLIYSSIATLEQADWQLLSSLLFEVQILRLKNLQLLEIVFSYFNCLSRGKSLSLHLYKMYEKEVIS